MTRLPLRTRVFGVVQGLVAKPATDEASMVAMRAARERLLRTRMGVWLFGADAEGTVVSEHTVNGLRLRIHTPRDGDGPRPVVIDYHGGGWCLGSPEQSRWLAGEVAARTGAVVVSPAYRLAPEHPYPAAVDDAWTVLEWVAAHAAELGGDPDRIAVMGDSAGGNLAAVVALRARDAGPALTGQVLVYPSVDAYERWPSEDTYANAPVLTSAGMRTFARLYLGEAYGTEDWQVSPIRATSHADLPPTLIITAGHDPLKDNGTKYAEVLAAAGVRVDLRDHPAAIHGFMSLPGAVPAARDGLDQVVEFLRKVL